MIGIIDYGMGNLLSVYHAIEMIGQDVKICRHPEDLHDIERIILPGVGAFRDCLFNLKKTGFADVLTEAVIQKGALILGICLGMQAMALRSFEGEENEGLGWFDAEVIRLQPKDAALRIPHIGWNQVYYHSGNPLFKGLPEAPDFYFVHSYFMKCKNPVEEIATSDYGGSFTAAIAKKNLFGTQFHPEKSQDYGLRILENFASLRL